MYKLTLEGYVIKDGNIKIPTTPYPDGPNTNPEYLAYLEWVAQGNTALPAD